jgi:hypothetical protein
VGTLTGVSYGLLSVSALRQPVRISRRTLTLASQWHISKGNRFALAFLLTLGDPPASWLMASHARLELKATADTA